MLGTWYTVRRYIAIIIETVIFLLGADPNPQTAKVADVQDKEEKSTVPCLKSYRQKHYPERENLINWVLSTFKL